MPQLVRLQDVCQAPLTISQCAYLLALYDRAQFAVPAEYAMLKDALSKADCESLPCIPRPATPRADPREAPPPVTPLPVKIYTDYEMLLPLLAKNKDVEVVSTLQEADFAHLVSQRIKDFLTIEPRVSSFPYEGGFVRKDLLPLLVRQYCYSGREAAADNKNNNLVSADKHSGAPFWWLPCFDLSTEFHLFAHHFAKQIEKKQGGKEDEQPAWIIKPSQLARGKGHQIVVGRDLRRVCLARARANNVDFVAQQLVTRPLCVKGGRKFDLRVFAFVRSFVPFEAYMHHFYYARLANKPYDSAKVEVDDEIALTVSGYNEDKTIADKQERLTRAGLRRHLLEENPGLDYDGMMAQVEQLMRELFSGVVPSVGHWPRSSAYYSVDVLFDRQEEEGCCCLPVPKLVEVNFMGDVRAVETASKMEYEQDEGGMCLQDWVDDLVTVLATQHAVPATARMTRL